MCATPALAYLIAMKFQRQRNELKRNWELMFQRAIWGTLLVGETTGLSAFLLWWLV
jgi:hypothetical protein